MTHYLIVEDIGDGEYDLSVEHDEDCPTEVIYTDPEGRPVTDFTCGVGYWTNNYGFMDLEDDKRLTTPGKYEIEFYSYTPQSMFASVPPVVSES